MNGDQQMVTDLLLSLAALVEQQEPEADLIVCPPAIYLPLASKLIEGKTICLGAQTLSEHSNGAYTGELSLAMLEDLQLNFVIVGHSERREYFGESNADVANKFAVATNSSITPILCVGETLAQRQAGKTLDVIAEQIDAVFAVAGDHAFGNSVIAYEPVWAIGTGETATPEQAQEVHAAIRQMLAEKNLRYAERTHILYGGSMKPNNAAELLAQPDVDGGLVGGASLKADDFYAIARAAR